MSVEVLHGATVDMATAANLVWRRVSPEAESPPPDVGFAAWFAQWATEHAATHVPFVAAENGASVGIGWLAVSERVPGPDRRLRFCGDIQSVYVLPERRNAGIGTELVRAMLVYADAHGLEHITVHSSERAVSLPRDRLLTQRGASVPAAPIRPWDPLGRRRGHGRCRSQAFDACRTCTS